MAPKARFTDGEKVLCFHGPLLYEAKCLRSQIIDKHMKYFIHYNGWNKNWDEWVSDCRVLKYNETNLQKQKELEKTHMKSKKTKPRISIKREKDVDKEPTPSTSQEKPPPEKKAKTEKKVTIVLPHKEIKIEPREVPEAPPEKKKKPRVEPAFEDEVIVEPEIKIDIPPVLNDWLIDDGDLINRQKKILHLPAKITVDHIIASYVKEKVSVKGLPKSKETTIVQIANKIRDCFNVLLGKCLLYKFERPQYAEILAEYHDSNACQIYGTIHLLRMFSKIEKFLTPGERGILSLLDHLNDFVRFLSMHKNFFSLDDYIVASPEYHRRALC